MTQEHTMTDVEKLKEAIATMQLWSSGSWTVHQLDAGVFAERAHLVIEAARSTLPKMKTVEVECWAVIDNEAAVVVCFKVRGNAEAEARKLNAGQGLWEPYTVVRLTGTAEIPA